MTYFERIITAIYATIFLISILANAITIFKLYFVKTPIKPFLTFLTISDVSFLLLSTFDAISFLKHKWIFGNELCIAQALLIESSFNISITTLTFLSISRYKTICNTFTTPNTKLHRSNKIILISISIFSVLTQIPSTLTYHLYDSACCNTKYGSKFRLIVFSINTFFFFITPAIIITVSHVSIILFLRRHNTFDPDVIFNTKHIDQNPVVHIRKLKRNTKRDQNKKLTRTLILLSTTLFLTWTPFIILRMLKYTGYKIDKRIWVSSQCATLLHTALNPFLYCFPSINPFPCFRH